MALQRNGLHQVARGQVQGQPGAQWLNDSDVTARIVIEMRPRAVGRRARVKAAFDREGIEIPSPRRVPHPRSEAADAAAEAQAA